MIENKMPYMMGFCPQCDQAIMVRDTGGMYSGRKPNFAQADIYFQDIVNPVRTIICKTCLANPNFETIMTAITAEGSQATIPQWIGLIKSFGTPLKIVPVTG